MDQDRFAIEPDLSLASTLPSSCYIDPEMLPLETERVFHRTWQLVGRAEQVAQEGDYFTCSVPEEPLVVVRAPSGIRAYHNVCRHRAGPVAEGAGRRRSLQCRYHGWTYDLSGKLIGTPEFDGVRCFEREQNGLCPVRIEEWAGFLFVNLDPAAPPLAEFLGSIPKETAGLPLVQMRQYKRVDYEVGCNWKVYVDNYLEGYHIPLVHPALFRELDYSAYRAEAGRYHSRQHAPLRNRPDSQALYYWVFPNLMLNVYPDNVQVNIILPLSPTRTLTVFEWYLLRPDRPGAAEEFARSFAFSDNVQHEDIAICEAVQRGLRSRSYDRGRFCARHENGVHHFHGLLCEFLKQEGSSPREGP